MGKINYNIKNQEAHEVRRRNRIRIKNAIRNKNENRVNRIARVVLERCDKELRTTMNKEKNQKPTLLIPATDLRSIRVILERCDKLSQNRKAAESVESPRNYVFRQSRVARIPSSSETLANSPICVPSTSSCIETTGIRVLQINTMRSAKGNRWNATAYCGKATWHPVIIGTIYQKAGDKLYLLWIRDGDEGSRSTVATTDGTSGDLQSPTRNDIHLTA